MQPESTPSRPATAHSEYKQTAPKEIQPVLMSFRCLKVAVSMETIKEGCSKKVIDAI
jgi:hypothetical protein